MNTFYQQNTEVGIHDDHVPQGVTHGHIEVIGHNSKEKIFQTDKRQDKTDLGEGACISDALILCWGISSIFGIVVVLKQMSGKDRLEKKKYMGLWRWESELTARMTSRFPGTVIRYMDRNRMKGRDWCSGSSVSPMRRKSETFVCFLDSMLLMNLI